MNEEYQYLSRVLAHENWHLKPLGNLSQNLSCHQCHPIDNNRIPEEFYEFWIYSQLSLESHPSGLPNGVIIVRCAYSEAFTI